MDWIDDRFIDFAEKPACYEVGRCWTYNDLSTETDRFADLISRIIEPVPAVIAIRLDCTMEAIAALLAVKQCRQIALPQYTDMPIAEQDEQQRIAKASFLLNKEGIEPLVSKTKKSGLINQLAERKHSGLILFSSGTSGEPKGMLHDLAALLDRYQTVRPRTDRTLQLLLTDHIGGLDSALRTLFAGSTLVVPEARTALAAGSAIEQHRVNILPASPTFLNLMLLAGVADKFDCSSLEIVAYGAERMPKELLTRLNMAFPHAQFQQKFGTSETGTVGIRGQNTESVYFRIDDPGVEWRVKNGELWLKTGSRILGYLNAEDTSLDADGWYRTGDLVDELEDGYLRIIGRRSDVINVGGQKVHPSEIEQVIAEMEDVDACFVFGKPAAITGNVVACRIVTKTDMDVRSWKRRIRKHCQSRLAGWKIPAVVELSKELSLTSRLKHG